MVLGALGSLAFAPLYVLPALPLAFTGLVWLLEGCPTWRMRALLTWFFAWGHFIAGLYWVGFAFFVDAEQFGWLVPFPVLGLPALLALFPAACLALAWRADWPRGPRVLLLAVGWTASEWLRGHVLSGFPWNEIGYVWGFSPAEMQAGALIGTLGLSLVTVAAAALPALFADRGRAAYAWLGAAFAVLVAIWLGGLWRLDSADEATLPGVKLRLVQANIPQKQRYTPKERQDRFERQLQLSASPGAQAITHLIWPESAIPTFIDMDPTPLHLLEDMLGPGRLLFSGADRRSPLDDPDIKVWNGLQVIGDKGIVATYDKRHLVPFGEYLPMRPLLALIGLNKLTAGTLDFSTGDSTRALAVPGLPPVRVLICYEDIFADEVWTGGERPGWLLNITNDAWFGESSGPYQHLATARFRAVEQGVPLVRVANTGITAIVDAEGRVVSELGLDRTGVLDGGLPRALSVPTPYARFGDLIPLALAIAACGLAIVTHRKSRAGRTSGDPARMG